MVNVRLSVFPNSRHGQRLGGSADIHVRSSISNYLGACSLLAVLRGYPSAVYLVMICHDLQLRDTVMVSAPREPASGKPAPIRLHVPQLRNKDHDITRGKWGSRCLSGVAEPEKRPDGTPVGMNDARFAQKSA